MNADLQLKLLAYADGELPDTEQHRVDEVLARDGEARALVAEQRQTRDLLAGNEAPHVLPLNGDFYWTRVRQEILRAETPSPANPPELSLIAWWRRLLVPAMAAAMLCLLLVPLLNKPAGASLASCNVETSAPESSVVAFHSEEEGVTVVWVDQP